MIGRRLGHYLVLERLGGGGMGEVYVAEDTRLTRKVALKLPRAEVTDSIDRRARFQREARATAALNHPNIVHVYSVEELDGLIFLTMELVPGRSLRELLRSGAALPLAKTLAIACQLADGLACAHAAGVLHRDLKPGNVMITAEERVKILDFGLAKFLGPAPRRIRRPRPRLVTRRPTASRSGPPATWLRSRRSARRSIPAPISSRSAP